MTNICKLNFFYVGSYLSYISNPFFKESNHTTFLFYNSSFCPEPHLTKMMVPAIGCSSENDDHMPKRSGYLNSQCVCLFPMQSAIMSLRTIQPTSHAAYRLGWPGPNAQLWIRKNGCAGTRDLSLFTLVGMEKNSCWRYFYQNERFLRTTDDRLWGSSGKAPHDLHFILVSKWV